MRTYKFMLLLALLVVFLLAGRAEALEVSLGEKMVSRRAELVEGTAYIPLRDLLSALGEWRITWDNETQSACAEGPLFPLTLSAGSLEAQVEGYPLALGSPPLLRGETLFVPLRSVANLCGASVTWNGGGSPITMEAPESPNSYGEDDLYWLSRIISAESQGEPLAGQIAVGTVVLNRVEHPDFPDTIHGVIFDDAYAIQFEPVENGAIYAEPVPSSILAARMVLSGTRIAGGSLYFYNPALSEDTWIASHRTYYTTIGSHRFFL